MWPNKVLMVEPDGFDIKYAINPHMKTESGALNTVDKNKARQQWSDLKDTFTHLGLEVSLVPGSTELPDMVFCANPFFPFLKEGNGHIVLSHMHSQFRQQEPELYKQWAQQKGTSVHSLSTPQAFEGMGDALWNYDTMEMFGGYGFRTDVSVYDELETLTQRPVHRLKLVSEHFYHLDTCLCILSKDKAMYVKEAFDQKGRALLQEKFADLIEIPHEEAIKGFAGNACSVNGRDILLPTGCTSTKELLKQHGFTVHELDTSEFIKSGGSIFCMKMLYW